MNTTHATTPARAPFDAVFHNGRVLVSAARPGATPSAIAVRGGRVAATGTAAELLAGAGPATETVDLAGRLLMPGLIDAHLHPLWGAKALANPSLNYEPLTVPQTLARLRNILDADPGAPDDHWLVVQGWLRLGGSDVDRDDLDKLPTRRPILIFSNDCHSAALNSRALDRLGINENTPDEPDGTIVRRPGRRPAGLIEDAPAMRLFDRVTHLAPQAAARLLENAQRALNAQGVTAVLDARALPEQFEAFALLRAQRRLTLRVAAAVEIPPTRVRDVSQVENALRELDVFRAKYAPVRWGNPAPDLAVTHSKFFVDGMLPNKTAFMRHPYFENTGGAGTPALRQTDYRARPYYTAAQLEALFNASARHGFHPHMHIIADGAADLTLDALEKTRAAHPRRDFRPSMAHNDLMSPDLYARFRALGVIATLSYQWCAMPASMWPLFRDVTGDERFHRDLETHGKFFDAGVTVAYGSDWPIDPLNEWYNLQCGLTRRIGPGHPRLDSDRDLTVPEVLRSATLNAARQLGLERHIGSLEPGKYADFIVLDRDVLKTPPESFAETKVLRTVVAGKTVHEA
ncbi:MAG: amidohydrolase [Opitutaceae bacterium]|jgi:predicted amidohydrolase YtcJ|nr:amidohydrolase [Opitutaceae bacterium]